MGRKRRWGPQALVLLRALYKHAETDAEFYRKEVSEAEAKADATPVQDGHVYWSREADLRLAKRLERESLATKFVLLELLGPQGPLVPGMDREAARVDDVLDVWGQLTDARRRFHDLHFDRGPAPPQAATEPQEESRQAHEPASPACGSRRAKGRLPNESGPGGALTPAEPFATLPKKGRVP